MNATLNTDEMTCQRDDDDERTKGGEILDIFFVGNWYSDGLVKFDMDNDFLQNLSFLKFKRF